MRDLNDNEFVNFFQYLHEFNQTNLNHKFSNAKNKNVNRLNITKKKFKIKMKIDHEI